MAYVIRRDEPVGEEIIRILAEQNRRALGLLRRWEDHPRDNVHQARQALKRIRAGLRLIRSGAPYVYRVENALFRDIGLELAYARDTEAVIEALGLLSERVTGPLARDALRMLRVGLEQRAARERDCGIHDLAGRISGACGKLEAAGRRFRDLPLGALRRKDLRRGMEATLARCADGFARARASGLAEDLHAWRKDVKYASHQARLVQRLPVRRAAALGPALADLAVLLGHHHDLVVLDSLLRNQPDDLGVDVHLQAIRRALREAQGAIATQALALGARTVGRLLPPQAAEPAGSRA